MHGGSGSTGAARSGARSVLVLCAVALAAACGSGHPGPAARRSPSTGSSPSPPPGSSSSTAARVPATASPGCGRPVAPGTGTLVLAGAGGRRTVRVHVPAGYRPSVPSPLVLDLHGSGSTARGQEQFSGMDATADRDGFVVAYPQAAIPAGSGFDWDVPGVPLAGGSAVPAGAPDDVSFLTGLVPQLGSLYCIDLARVYATGMSGGGRMASQLACDAAGTFAAVAPVAGLRAPSPCPGTRAVPVVAFHGTADPVDPFGGGGPAYWTYGVPTAAARWAAHDGCATPPRTTRGAGYTETSYAGCRGGAGVVLYAVTGAGHEWPGGPPMPAAVTRALGPQSDAVDADTVMWQFFAAHPLP